MVPVDTLQSMLEDPSRGSNATQYLPAMEVGMRAEIEKMQSEGKCRVGDTKIKSPQLRAHFVHQGACTIFHGSYG